ncbi:MAG: hypothetical protein CMO01_04250, partial [Thalassobius sp.]|nr:hypothetical protein [Thalassovita sp.]
MLIRNNKLTLLFFFFIFLVSTTKIPLNTKELHLKNEFLDGIFPRASSTTPFIAKIYFSEPPLESDEYTKAIPMPNTNKIIVLSKKGVIYSFDNDENVKTTSVLLDISDSVMSIQDAGLLGIAFHPEFYNTESKHNREVYLAYTYKFRDIRPLYNRLSRFKFNETYDSIIRSSEEVIIQQYDRQEYHNGGALFFDNEDYLYLSLGDEGWCCDAARNSQKIDEALFGGIIRIDVNLDSTRSHPIRRFPVIREDKPEDFPDNINQHYMIPNDNPWVDESGKNLEEFYAIGLRSPHTMSYDSISENIWLGDVGENAREEINLIKKGSNAQWPYKEGTYNFYTDRKPEVIIGTELPPVYDYGRDQGRCVIGGFVYRGQKFNELNGKYLFADYVSGNVWALNPDDNYNADLLLTTSPRLSSLFTDKNGDIFILNLFGEISKIEVNPSLSSPPKLLSETNAFDNLKDMTPSEGIVPYEVNSPLWSDGASKKRWISIPNESEGIHFSKDSSWQFPVGTVFIKHFELPTDTGSFVKVETRFFVIDEEGKGYGITYKWNKEGTDATLIGEDESVSEDFTFLKNGVLATQTWNYPTRSQCLTCHNENAGYVLGVKSSQLNKTCTDEATGFTENQLISWKKNSFFSSDSIELFVDNLPKLYSLNDTTASLTNQVRSYIDANCSFCHRPNGVEGAFDARFSTPLSEQNLINHEVASRNSTIGNKIIFPLNSDSSELWIRDSSLGENKMPPLGKTKLDNEYLNVLDAWIQSLQFSINEDSTICKNSEYT